MSIRHIRTRGDPVLNMRCKPVKRFDTLLVQLLDDMAETMYAAPGVGLAANQVGVSLRVITVDIGEEIFRLVNPKIVSRQGSEVALEGCLSVPNLWGEVERAAQVVVKAQDETGKWRRIEAQGFLARAFQHEIDHLDGKLFVDRALNLVGPEDLARAEEPEEPANPAITGELTPATGGLTPISQLDVGNRLSVPDADANRLSNADAKLVESL